MMNGNMNANRKLVHPLWTHLPAVAALLVMLGYLISVGTLPAEAPIHFDTHGVVDTYGSPWTFLGVTIGFSVFFIGLSVFFDELWARQEKKKTFNWLSFLDDIVVGWLCGMGLGYLVGLNSGGDIFNYPWIYGLAMAGGAVGFNLILELVRPFRLYRGKTEPVEESAFKEDIAARIKTDSQFVYWENQNPLYVTLMSTLLPLLFIAIAVIVWVTEGWVTLTYFFSPGMIIIGLLIAALTFGGQRVTVGRQEVAVRWGALGLRVMRVNVAEIAGLEIMEFAPLRDFGGYGIRIGQGMTAYYMRGNRGVKITRVNGKKYLVGSDRPERLLAVLEQVTGK